MEGTRHTQEWVGNCVDYTFQFQKYRDKFDVLWQMKSSTRENLRDWLLASDIARHTAENCANACSELIENCIQYMPEGSEANVSISVNPEGVVVETLNSADVCHSNALRNAIMTLASTPNLQQAFVAKLASTDAHENQIGLVRIAFETNGELQLISHDDPKMIHLKVRMPFQ